MGPALPGPEPLIPAVQGREHLGSGPQGPAQLRPEPVVKSKQTKNQSSEVPQVRSGKWTYVCVSEAQSIYRLFTPLISLDGQI